MSVSIDQIRKIRNDPMEFLKCVRTLDQVDAKMPIKHFPTDLEYIRLYVRVWEKVRFLAVPKSRRMKMSWINVILYTWDTMFHFGRHNAFVSKKEDDADELVRRARFIVENIDHDLLPKEVIPKMDYKFGKLIFPEIKSMIQGFPQGADQLRAYTFSGILADEMAFWEMAQKMYSASFPTIEGGGRFTAVSSPGDGFFKQLVFDQLDQAHGIVSEDVRELYPY